MKYSLDGRVVPTVNGFKEYDNKSKGNPYHDKLGRFATGPGGGSGASVKTSKRGESERGAIAPKTKGDPDGLGLTKRGYSYEKTEKSGKGNDSTYYLRQKERGEDFYEDVLAFEKVKGKKSLRVLELPTWSRLPGQEFDSLDSLVEAYKKEIRNY